MSNCEFIKINDSDNVITLLRNFEEGETLDKASDINNSIRIAEDIEAGFKVAVTEIKKGEDIVKYGEVIGRATENIFPGEKVHVHNVEGKRARGDIKSKRCDD